MPATGVEVPIRILVEGASLEGTLTRGPGAAGLILLASGEGAASESPSSEYVAAAFQKAGFATLLINLFTESESGEPEYRFHAGMAGRRLHEVMLWAGIQESLRDLPTGVFATGTAVAAALVAAAHPGNSARALVSRGGRPDLAWEALETIAVPTLFIVGQRDYGNIEINEEAMCRVKAPAQLVFVDKATHFFEQEGALEEVARQATKWFKRWVCPDAGDAV